MHSVYQHPQLKSENLTEIVNLHSLVQFNKGDFFLNRGDQSDCYLVMEKGLMCSFVIDYDGNDITTNFFTNHEVVIEVLSIFKRIPTEECIQALTDCTCWKIDLVEFEKLFRSMPGLSEWGRTWMSEQLFQSKQRSVEMITERAVARYLRLIKEKPQVIREAPLKQIASYLGITDTSLSRIRKELTKGSYLASR